MNAQKSPAMKFLPIAEVWMELSGESCLAYLSAVPYGELRSRSSIRHDSTTGSETVWMMTASMSIARE